MNSSQNPSQMLRREGGLAKQEVGVGWDMQRQRSSMKQVRVQDSKEADVKSDSSRSHIGGVFTRSEQLLDVY